MTKPGVTGHFSDRLKRKNNEYGTNTLNVDMLISWSGNELYNYQVSLPKYCCKMITRELEVRIFACSSDGISQHKLHQFVTNCVGEAKKSASKYLVYLFALLR